MEFEWTVLTGPHTSRNPVWFEWLLGELDAFKETKEKKNISLNETLPPSPIQMDIYTPERETGTFAPFFSNFSNTD